MLPLCVGEKEHPYIYNYNCTYLFHFSNFQQIYYNNIISDFVHANIPRIKMVLPRDILTTTLGLFLPLVGGNYFRGSTRIVDGGALERSGGYDGLVFVDTMSEG